MRQTHSQYADYHPRWLRPQVSTYWWLERRSYFVFILRELSCDLRRAGSSCIC